MRYHNPYINNQDQNEELLNSILDCSTEYALIATDLDDRIVLWNNGAQNIYGYSSREMLGKQIPMDLLHKTNTINNDLLFLTNNTFKENVKEQKMDAMRKDGSTIPVTVTVTTRENMFGETIGFLTIVHDFTQIRLQEQYRETLIEITHIVNSSTEVSTMCELVISAITNFLNIPIAYICLLDKHNNKFSINSQTGLIGSYSSHSCQYYDSEQKVPDDKKTCYISYNQMIINSVNLSEHNISNFVQIQNNDIADISIIHIPLLSDIELIGLLHIVVPIKRKQLFLNETQILSLIANEIAAGIQRKRLEEENKEYANDLERMVKERTDELRKKDSQLVQSGKLATLGEIATGIAHEINQPLGAINLMAQGLLIAKSKNKCSDELLDEKLSSIVEQIERISKIIAHLRTFARQSSEITTNININDPIMDVFKLIGEQLKTHDIHVHLELFENIKPVNADHNKLEQVFLNIIGNARDALYDLEEKIKHNISENTPDWVKSWEKNIYIKTYEDSGFVIAEITDNGGGINKSTQDKIFEPFFTTKEVGKGTGLGLSISYGIIKEFNGTIEVKSKLSEGTTFIVKLPACSA
jgi:two-component system, NtrC family, sensor kinase